MSQIFLFDHAGARFVSGLFWQVLSKPREAAQEAKELGESMNFDYLTMRNSGAVMQAGFVAKADGAVDNMVSMAAVLSRAIESGEDGDPPQNWLAAILLPSGDYAYAAVRDGAFLPDGDVAGPKDDIIGRMSGDYGLGEWDIVFAPEDFGFPGSIDRPFEEFLALDKKGSFKAVPSVMVRPVAKQIPWKIIGIAVGAMIVVGVLFKVGMGYLESKAAAERENSMRTQEARMAEEQRQKALATPPWAAVADTGDFLRKCEKVIFAVPFNPAGWSIANMACLREGAMTAEFKRGDRGASLFDLKREMGDKVRVDWSGEAAVMQEKVEFDKAPRESLWFANEAVQELVGRFQVLGAKVSVTDASAAPGPGLPNAQAASPLKFKLLGFSVITNIRPSDYATAFAVPGVRIKDVKVTPTGEWTTEGEIYVEPPK